MAYSDHGIDSDVLATPFKAIKLNANEESLSLYKTTPNQANKYCKDTIKTIHSSVLAPSENTQSTWD